MIPNTKHQTPNIKLAFFNTSATTQDFEVREVTGKIISKQSITYQNVRAMISNYKYFVQDYKQQCSVRNAAIIKYNANVIAFIEQNKQHELCKTVTSTFKATVGKVSILEYNLAAIIVNTKNNKPLIQLKKHTAIPVSYEKTFVEIIIKYARQIESKTNILESKSATTVRALQRVSINHYELANTVVNDLKRLDFCKKTVQNHVNRFVDAGLLFDYSFHGHQKPVQYFVNNQILEIDDLKTRKTLNAQNQLYNYQIEKDLPNNDIVTSTYKNKKEIKENVNKHSRIKGVATPKELLQTMQLSQKFDNYKNNYKNTKLPKQKNKLEAQNFSPKINQLSDILYAQIQNVSTLMQDLSKGKYVNHRYILKEEFEKEAISGNLLREDFLKLLQQEFCKNVAPIYKNRKAFIGSWYKAYNFNIYQLFLNNNSSIPNKYNLLGKFENLMWRLSRAKYILEQNPDYNSLFPNDYFDPTRKCKKSGGFANTLNALKEHLINIDAAAKHKAKQNAKVGPRNLRYKAISLVEKKVKSLKNGKITISQFFDYIHNNQHIPQDIAANAQKYIIDQFKTD